MSTSKKSRLDLLVRVRYLNPIPPPPFPPKLFNLPTNIHRLGEPSYLDHLASSTPLPMLVDSEMGMPLVLNDYERIWEGRDEAINPSIDPNRVHDPTDVVLLAPSRSQMESNDKTPLPPSDVSWMRSSNLFTRKGGAKREALKTLDLELEVDASLSAQMLAIEKSFAALQDSAIADMRHPDPKKRHLSVVESYDILPDSDTWANSYFLIKFPERPEFASYRLDKAVLRPVREDDQQFMEYHLPGENDVGKLDEMYSRPMDEEQCREVRTLLEENPDDTAQHFNHATYERIRTYEVFTQDSAKKEILLVIDEGSTKRHKAAYYKDINLRTALRKTRMEGQAEQWDGIRVGARESFREELEARGKLGAVTNEPNWINEQLRGIRGTNDAERLGEGMEEPS